MSDQVDSTQTIPNGLSVQAAAEHLGCSEKTVRRRIKAGDLRAIKKPTSQGYEWRVYLNGHGSGHIDSSAAQIDNHSDHASSQKKSPSDHSPSQHDGHLDDAVDQADGTLIFRSVETDQALLKALELTERLQRENMELAGRVGFLQAKLQSTEEKLLALTPGNDPAPTKQRPWWQFW